MGRVSTVAEKRKNATIHDVAASAGVAVGTVSRYLNGQTVRQGNRLAIERAIEQLSFQRNALAKAMKSETTDVIGFLTPIIDEFHAELLNHLVRQFRHGGRTMLTYCHDDDGKLLREALSFFAKQRVDALVVAGSGHFTPDIETLVERGLPIVVYNNDLTGLGVDRVFVENANAAFRAVSHLVDVGHRRIATAYGLQSQSSGVQRLEGYRRALEAHGLAVDPAYMHPGNWGEEGGYSAVQKFMALAEPPTAIFSANYKMTVGILEWVREHGLRVPADLAIVSFDDVELFRLYDGGITAVKQPIDKIAESIVSYVLSRLSGNELPEIRTRTLDCNVILRGSSGYVG
ncbi:Transcriptional regulator LacI family [uncultured Pleomorphomonas sp.]|uniref:Transcriptional regulator LacI family n=1 Tax=uncultured Pleomorphomonas sp. TaxID=442121 RepID=A0A212LGX5_9HYPH|nr:Transcriptional regulator LacI family [uncultured Pleomorphomonas sp.]